MFCADNSASWKEEATAGLGKAEAGYMLALCRCLDDLFRKSDAVYGQWLSDDAHQKLVLECARGLSHIDHVKDLAMLFQRHWRHCALAPAPGDIVAAQARARSPAILAAEARKAGFVLVKGGLE